MRARSVLLILLIIFAAGCAAKAPSRGTAPEPVLTEKAAKEEVFASRAALPEQVGEPAATEERKVIKSAYIKLEVGDFDTAVSEVERLASEAGGYVAQSNYYLTAGNHRRGTITIRVPESSFGSVIQEIRRLGKVLSFSSTGRDVTEEYIDLEARLRNLKRQEERLLELLDRAESVKDVLEVERELGRVRGEIERLEGRLRYLNNRVEFATITVELVEPEPIAQSLGLRSAISDAVKGLVTVTRALIVAVGYLLPLAVLGAVFFALFRRMRR